MVLFSADWGDGTCGPHDNRSRRRGNFSSSGRVAITFLDLGWYVVGSSMKVGGVDGLLSRRQRRRQIVPSEYHKLRHSQYQNCYYNNSTSYATNRPLRWLRDSAKWTHGACLMRWMSTVHRDDFGASTIHIKSNQPMHGILLSLVLEPAQPTDTVPRDFYYVGELRKQGY